jgi:hypothetical protein
MKKLSLIIATILFSFGVANAVVVPTGDDTHKASHGVEIKIPTVALVDVEGVGGEAGTINLIPDVSALEAGEAVKFSSVNDNSLWLNYTSIVKKDQVRNITTEISGNLPSGVSLKLSASSISTGKGKTGQPTEEISLTSTAQKLITGIGSCYTETGNGKGHQLKYTLDMDNEKYADLMADNYEIKVTYTITD